MQVRCPQCQTPVELASDGKLSDIVCPSCGSSFSLLGTEETVPFEREVRTIGHFDLVEQVGIGTFGTVWKARDKELDRVVAVKIPRKGQLDPDETEQFLREARAAAQLRHPSIVSVHEVGRQQDTVFIVSDFVEGVTLADRLTAQRFSVREAVELCAKIAGALHHAHEAGVIHRDLKPGNTILDAAGDPHIMDFGLARREAGEVTMTVEGRVLGTPAYMSPEQAKGASHTADRRSDVYSLGVILFELLTGERPFRGNIRMLVHQVINDEPPSPRRLNGAVPRDLETIVLKCLEKEPKKRYETAKAFADDLQRFVVGQAIEARPISRLERAWRWSKRNPVVSALTTAVGVSLVIGAAISAYFATVALDQKNRADAGAERSHRLLYISDMNVAQQAWEENNVMRVRELLERHRPVQERGSSVGFEWYYLWRLLQQSQEPKRISLGDPAYDVEFSPDGSVLAVGHMHGPLVTLYDAKTFAMIDRFPRGDRREFHTTRIAFSPDGASLAYRADLSLDWTSIKTKIVLRTLKTKKEQEFEGKGPPVFSPDGSLLASASDEGITIWSRTSHEIKMTSVPPEEPGWSKIAFSPDGNLIAYSTRDNRLTIRDLSDREVRRLDLPNGKVQTLSFTPNGNALIFCDGDGYVHLWNLQSDKVVSRHGHADAVFAMALSRSGGVLATGSRDMSIKLWNVADLSERRTLKWHAGIIIDLAFSPDGESLASAAIDHNVMVWRVADPERSTPVETISASSVGSKGAFLLTFRTPRRELILVI